MILTLPVLMRADRLFHRLGDHHRGGDPRRTAARCHYLAGLLGPAHAERQQLGAPRACRIRALLVFAVIC